MVRGETNLKPSPAGVYLIIGHRVKDGQEEWCLYVGCTCNLSRRCKKHEDQIAAVQEGNVNHTQHVHRFIGARGEGWRHKIKVSGKFKQNLTTNYTRFYAETVMMMVLRTLAPLTRDKSKTSAE